MFQLEGVSAQGGLPDTPLWTELQTGVKTLPCRNNVANGKYLYKADLDINSILLEMAWTWNTADMHTSCIPDSNSTEKLNLKLK